jgi:hypothetical protein
MVSMYAIRLERTKGIDEPTRLARRLDQIHSVYMAVVAGIHTAAAGAYKGFFPHKY